MRPGVRGGIQLGMEGLPLGAGAGLLACSMRGLAAHSHAPATSAKGLFDWFSSSGARAVVLDATHPELRPRDLGRSARRDLASAIRRSELEWKGIDVFVPTAHLASREHSDRALSAVIGAIEMAGELATLNIGEHAVVSFDLPDEPVEGVVREIASAAERTGVLAACLKDGHAGLCRAVDLDAMAEAGVDAVGAVTSATTAQVRWGGPRVERRVDLLAVTGAIAIRAEPCSAVLDLSKSMEPAQAIGAAIAAWSKADPASGLGL